MLLSPGGLARQAVRVEMTLQELCSRRLQAHLSRDDPATWLKNINVVPCSPQPTKARRTYKQPFDPLCLSLISQPMPSPDTRARSGAGAPSGSASGLNLRWGRRGPLGESEGLCFLWLLWNSLSSPPPPVSTPLVNIALTFHHLFVQREPDTLARGPRRPPPPPSSVTSLNPAHWRQQQPPLNPGAAPCRVLPQDTHALSHRLPCFQVPPKTLVPPILRDVS